MEKTIFIRGKQGINVKINIKDGQRRKFTYAVFTIHKFCKPLNSVFENILFVVMFTSKKSLKVKRL